MSKYEPPMEESTKIAWTVLIGIAFVGILIGAWFLRSYMEAQAYNRVTGENVSAWDAMWIELRVQSGPRESR